MDYAPILVLFYLSLKLAQLGLSQSLSYFVFFWDVIVCFIFLFNCIRSPNFNLSISKIANIHTLYPNLQSLDHSSNQLQREITGIGEYLNRLVKENAWIPQNEQYGTSCRCFVVVTFLVNIFICLSKLLSL